MPKLILSDGDIEAIILDVYRGLIKPDNLPVDLYLATADELKKAVYKGYKSNLSSLEFGTPDYDLLNELRTNTYMFSAAKTAKQCAAMSSLMVENNELLKYKEFKVKALNEFKIYNTDWLKTEFETAITTAQTAR